MLFPLAALFPVIAKAPDAKRIYGSGKVVFDTENYGTAKLWAKKMYEEAARDSYFRKFMPRYRHAMVLNKQPGKLSGRDRVRSKYKLYRQLRKKYLTVDHSKIRFEERGFEYDTKTAIIIIYDT